MNKIVPHVYDASTELAAQRGYKLALEPSSFESAMDLAKLLAATRYCGITSPQDALTRIMTGRELGLSAMQSIRAVYIIEGKPSLDSAFMHGLCLQSPECEAFDCAVEGPDSVTYSVKRRGRAAQLITYSLDDAKRAGLLNRPMWQKYPREMLHARAKSTAARRVFPDLLFGLYIPDEVGDPSVMSVVNDNAQPVTVAPPLAPQAAVVDAETIYAREDYLKKIEAAAPSDAPALRQEIQRAIALGYLSAEDRKELQTAFTARFPGPKKARPRPTPVADEQGVIAPEQAPEAVVVAEAVGDGIVDRGDDPNAY